MTAEEAGFQSIAVVGPGLLGGSILKAVRKFQPKCELRIWARRLEALQPILDQGLSDFADTDLEVVVGGADLVILAMPIQYMAEIVSRFPALKEGCIVTDVGSTKASVVSSLTAPVKQRGGTFIGSHPMAGSEKTGIEYATAELFEGAPAIITPGDEVSVSQIQRLAEFWKALGCEVAQVAPGEHDRIVSAISHLPHLVASSLVLATVRKDPQSGAFSGGGFRDSTRIAGGDPDMWAEIMIDNQPALLQSLDGMIAELSNWRDALAKRDKEAVRHFLSIAKESRDKVKDR